MARAIWSGSISFGLVNIPIRLFTAVRDHSIQLHMLTPDGQCRLRRKLYCPDTGEEYDFKEAARGYEIAPGQYVIVREEERENLKAEAGRTIDIVDFVRQEQIDPVYFDRPYYVLPDQAGVRGYQLLLRAMREQQKIAVGSFVMRSKEYLAALRPMGAVLALETMRYADEVVDPERELEIPAEVEVNRGELEMAERLIEALARHFDPTKYRDEYRDRLEELIQRKAEGERVVTHPPEEGGPAKVVDLMEALERSLQGVGGNGRKARKETKRSSSRRKKSRSA